MLVENIDKKVGPEFDGKVLLITGGTGSFGNAVLRRFLNSGLKEIRIFSRDEKKQDDMRQRLQNDKVKFYIGDVRDYHSIDEAMRGVDYVFHAAALKQVPSCEFYPGEAVRTNINGTENAVRAAHHRKVKRFVLLSTDKAVYPINTMGMTKAVAEKVVRAYARGVPESETIYNITRYGNVMASRGSVIPLFVEQIKAGRDITVTDPEMTRFLMSLDEAVDLVLYAFLNGGQGDTFIPRATASTIRELAEAIIELFDPERRSKVHVIGTRHGEKKHETLINREELVRSERIDNFYRIFNDTRDLNYAKYTESGSQDVSEIVDYTSNQELLDIEGIKQLLLTLPYIQAQLKTARDADEGLV
ncbi:MAG: SDR family NAD(P)-dependent oxidoreductase [Oscillospiraceae bacterium]|nr:SDR family NAD(P)-dependent oxidoreductase [Oscillospiraceae bacterium]